MMDRGTSSTLWMGDLEPYMDEFFILQAFENMGETAQQVKMIHNKMSGTGQEDNFEKIYGQEREISRTVGHKYPELRLPAGYCFVDFPSTEIAQRAMLRLNGKIIPNSQPPHRFKLNSNYLSKDQPFKNEFSLFVGELSSDVDDYVLYTAFSKRYLSCVTAKVVLDSRGYSKGYGFVRFSEETEQLKALIEMQHMTVGSRHIRVSLATPKKPPAATSAPPTQPPLPPQATPGMSGSYYGGYKSYEDYLKYYQQYYSTYYASQPGQPVPQAGDSAAAAGAIATTVPQEEDVLEEPELTVDVDKYNRDYMAQSEEIFELLEDSRWHPLDQWNSKVPATAR